MPYLLLYKCPTFKVIEVKVANQSLSWSASPPGFQSPEPYSATDVMVFTVMNRAALKSEGSELTIRAGHATILPRQRDHVFRPQTCFLFQYYYIDVATTVHLDTDN